MTKVGYDASKIQQRAEMIAKVQGAKRKWDETEDDDDEEMELAEGGDDAEGAGWMDVDEEGAPTKKVKTNSGGVISKREPKTNRQMAGLRDKGVSSFLIRKIVHRNR